MLRRLAHTAVWLCACTLCATTASQARAESDSSISLRSLDTQVQEIKSDMLSIAAELNLLEEQLLYPSGTQRSVFVALGRTESFRLDAVSIEINGNNAAHHIYEFKELDALQSGGVQRIYTGNLPTGTHEMRVLVVGKLDNGEDYTGERQFTFDKGVQPRLLGLTFNAPGTDATPIELSDW